MNVPNAASSGLNGRPVNHLSDRLTGDVASKAPTPPPHGPRLGAPGRFVVGGGLGWVARRALPFWPVDERRLRGLLPGNPLEPAERTRPVADQALPAGRVASLGAGGPPGDPGRTAGCGASLHLCQRSLHLPVGGAAGGPNRRGVGHDPGPGPGPDHLSPTVPVVLSPHDRPASGGGRVRDPRAASAGCAGDGVGRSGLKPGALGGCARPCVGGAVGAGLPGLGGGRFPRESASSGPRGAGPAAGPVPSPGPPGLPGGRRAPGATDGRPSPVQQSRLHRPGPCASLGRRRRLCLGAEHACGLGEHRGVSVASVPAGPPRRFSPKEQPLHREAPH